MKKINVCLIGMGFGQEFIEIYMNHPNVETVSLYDINSECLNKFASKYNLKTYDSFDAVLEDTNLDAVHLVTPIPLHEEQTVKVLLSGKHCACTVPMATSLKGIKKIVKVVKKSNKNYMMMETTLYTKHFLYIKKLIENNELGKVQFLRGCHYQDMNGWNDYWKGLPPMWYGSHAIGPLVALSNSKIKNVVCYGSGTMSKELQSQYNNPYPLESALFEFENGLKAEATRSLFEVARTYQEGLFVYGSKKSFEWGFKDHSYPYVTSLIKEENNRYFDTPVEEIKVPIFYTDLPKEIQKYTINRNQYDPSKHDESILNADSSSHHGSHPFMVHEFIMSIIENRKPLIDEHMAANIIAAGLCAHKSAIKNGKKIRLPNF